MSTFFFMPTEASEQAVNTDRIFLLLLALSAAILALVLFAIVVFSIRYRRGSKASRGNLPKVMTREFEVGWTSAVLFLALFIFWWTASSEISNIIAPPNAMEVHVIAKQWMWKTQHANGVREIDALHIPIEKPVTLIMTSQDVIHSFFVPAFRLKQDVLPGRYTQLNLTARTIGTFPLLCAEYCGTQHSGMTGQIDVMSAPDYANWLASQPQGDDLAAEGAALFRTQGCSGCHSGSSRVRAPDLRGLAGRAVPLADGRTVIADDAYLHDAIVQPKRDIAAGYEPIMPSYAGILSEGDINSIIAYLKSPAYAKGDQP
jgi:cytochrome c oxidase subunit 2